MERKIKAIEAVADSYKRQQHESKQYKKGAVLKGILIKKPGNVWKYNGKTYIKKGPVLFCGASSWVNVEDKDVERIILSDNYQNPD